MLTRRGSTRSWRRLRALVLDRDAHRCQVPVDTGRLCGARATHVDHIVPRSRGGSDSPTNLRAACATCNLRRGARSVSPDDVPEGRALTPGELQRRGFRW